MMTRWIFSIAVLALAGCGIGSASSTRPPPLGDTIRFTAGPCFGPCPVYSVTVKPDGAAQLAPRKFTAVPGDTRFTVTPAQYRNLRNAFAAYRPKTGQSERRGTKDDCARLATDHPSYEIVWTREGAKDTELNFYSGCHDAKYAKLRAAIASVPKLLDIEAMLKAKPE